MSKKMTAFLLALLFSVSVALIMEITPGLLAVVNIYQLFFWISILIAVPYNLYYLISSLCVVERNYGGSFLPFLNAVLFSGGLLLYVLGMGELGGGAAYQLIFLAPLIVLLLIPFFKTEKLGLAKVIILLTAGLGAVSIFSVDWMVTDLSMKGVFQIVGAAAIWALFSLLSVKNITKLTTNIYVYIMVGTMLATGLVLLKSEITLPPWETLGMLAVLAALVLLSLFIFSSMIKKVELSFWVTLVFFIPVMILIIRVANGYSVSLVEVMGVLVICSAAVAGLLIKSEE